MQPIEGLVLEGFYCINPFVMRALSGKADPVRENYECLLPSSASGIFDKRALKIKFKHYDSVTGSFEFDCWDEKGFSTGSGKLDSKTWIMSFSKKYVDPFTRPNEVLCEGVFGEYEGAVTIRGTFLPVGLPEDFCGVWELDGNRS